MATAARTYGVEDAEENPDTATTPRVFPGTLRGLLDAARCRSAAGAPKAVVIVKGKQRQVIRRYEDGQEAWSESSAKIRHEGRTRA